MKYLFVGGTFSETGGKSSKYMTELMYGLVGSGLHYGPDTSGSEECHYNGGDFETLDYLLSKTKNCDVVFWFANVENNSSRKIVEDIKVKNPKCILITSKRNDNDKYNFQEIISHALKIKSNLVVEFKKQNNLINATILDPLGNVFIQNSSDIKLVGKTLWNRVKELLTFTRVESVRIGSIPDYLKLSKEPDYDAGTDVFYDLVKKYAKTYHNLIHPKNTERLLGNCSFRCENGFPSFRNPNGLGIIYVSKRNIDKREIGGEGFVPIVLTDDHNKIYYFGNEKPSIDAPVQVRLYNYYKNVNFILHSHTYIDSKRMSRTKRIIPCGAIEEFDEIVELIHENVGNAYINLKGHGSLVFAENVRFLRDIPYVARNLPEVVE